MSELENQKVERQESESESESENENQFRLKSGVKGGTP